MKKTILSAFFVLALLPLFAVQTLAATTVTGTPTANSTSIGKYEKFELTFDISRTFTNTTDSTSMQYYMLPYYYYDAADTQQITAFPVPGPVGANGITIDAHFTSPTGKQITVPAFYMQDYTRGSGYRINLSS
ncbi:hypothetical protein KC640_01435, partial [Candidatus Dojkabacteria bacterium]|nr:hypothetical protein [Candidatus Dojkabacteria bacterium]